MNTIEFAIQQELDGETYYRNQSAKNEGNSLHVVCSMLADDERNHAVILQNKGNGAPFVLEKSALSKSTRNIFNKYR